MNDDSFSINLVSVLFQHVPPSVLRRCSLCPSQSFSLLVGVQPPRFRFILLELLRLLIVIVFRE